MEPVIKVEGLKKYFGDVRAVDDISFEVERGELFGFLGINGAGKSTTINMLCTLYAATAGSVEVCGYQVGKQDEEVRKRIGVVYQGNCLDDKLTVAENLFVRGVLYEKDHRKLRADIRRICGILELEDVYHRRLAKLSGGQKRRCEIARALVNAPEIMFLDEPTTGLDPATRKKVWASLERLRREEKMTIFLTTHYMEEAARASHIAIMDAGHLKEYGTPFSLKEKYAKDQLRLYSGSPGLEERLAALHAAYRKKEDYFVVAVPESMAALAVLDSVRELIDGFEMVQGSMDDVFLNVTGKTLEG
ncbi:MAG: ABC transporter ATP-binding protein [Lachnospiraceae bacterium]|nr:ABC transporter ATP-binding protein [Lachnospiraceae bacterium]MDE6939388.1 ABC transporter ATP-binding protein [Lachnospiraceae bacterium]MDE6992091.1 ABC transporter ATP-binding protein [Lachnospiraceae bacterium]MDE7002154.1 ABC transporter ATP-binding protein [Lachnospiraceae bacterium]